MTMNTEEEIRAFLMGYMDIEQRADFENRLMNDKVLRLEVMSLRRQQIMEAQSQLQQIKQNFGIKNPE